MSGDECIAPELCSDGDSICGGEPKACRLHDPCSCPQVIYLGAGDPQEPDIDPDCHIHGASFLTGEER